ncbi:MAG: hypothetical protein BWZ09_02641 [Alphaproteobacteria bacterium ADurb.BinA305]|nr:MAG: hypothetical protein BWZ09_02641 [Alphaproteobacteria bacterium ADurb.BinA305]
MEGEKHQAEHVDRRQQRRGRARRPEQRVAGRERPVEHLVLREETREPGYARDRERADQEGPVRDGKVTAQPPHPPQVLFAGKGVDHRAGPEEQQRLEEGVRVEVKDPGAEGADAHREEHQPELRHGRVRQHPLDVGLDEADGRGEQRGGHPDAGDDLEHAGGVRVEHGVAPDHVHAGRDHRGGVDQRRDRRRPLHRVWQPDVERQLRRLAGGPDEQQQGGCRERAECGRLGGERGDLARELREVEGAEPREQQRHAEQEPGIADPVDDERLLARVGGRLLLVPEPDEQVRAQPDALPPHEHHREVRGEHQDQHEGGEQVQVREIARVLGVGLLVHVGGRVQVDQRADPGDHQDHHHRERVEAQAQRHVEVAGGDPGVERLVDHPRVLGQPQQRARGGQGPREGQEHRPDGDAARGGLRQPPADPGVHQEPRERKERNQQQHVRVTDLHVPFTVHSSAITISGWYTRRGRATRAGGTAR